MAKFRVNAFGISVDGFGAGAEQSVDNPMGVGGLAMHEWAFATKTFRQMFGQEGGETGIDEEFAVRSFENVGAWILGRNMFGPVRGSWGDESWKQAAYAESPQHNLLSAPDLVKQSNDAIVAAFRAVLCAAVSASSIGGHIRDPDAVATSEASAHAAHLWALIPNSFAGHAQ